MTRNVSKWLTLSACLLAGAAGAQPDWITHSHGEVDSCGALPGVYVHEELNPSDNTVTYMTGVTCADLEAGWFAGPYTYEGLENTMPTGGVGGMYQVRSEGSEGSGSFDLRMLGIAPMGDFFPFPFAAPVYGVQLMAPPSVTGMAPGGIPKWSQGYGYLYDQSLPAVGEMAPGKWYLFPHIRSLGVQGTSVDVRSARFGALGFLAEVGPQGLEIVSPTRGWEDMSFDLEIADGAISGSFSFRQENPMIPDARGAQDYAYAEVEITEIFGRAIDPGTGGMLMTMGTGLATLYGAQGQSEIVGASLDMHAVRIPDDMPDEILAYFFKEETAPDDGELAPLQIPPGMNLEGMNIEGLDLQGLAPGGVPKWGN